MTSRRSRLGKSALRSGVVRQTNLGMVLELVRFDPLSRSELVEITGLTRSSIGGLVAELAELELVVERRPASTGNPGRPSPIVAIDRSRYGVLAMEVGVDSLSAAVVAIDGAMTRVIRSARPSEDGGVEPVVGALADLAAAVVATGDAVELIGAAVAVAGLVRNEDDRVMVAPNLGWVDVDLAGALQGALQPRLKRRLQVNVGNEVDLGALAESRFGAGRSADQMLFIAGEVGLGGSVIIDGERMAGHSGLAGEVGHLQINPAGVRCRCGAIGCWETEVGAAAMVARAGLETGPGTVEDVLQAAAAGDASTLEAMAETGRWFGVGLGGLINVIDPDVVVFGGLYGRILPYLRESLDAELERRRFRGLPREVPLEATELGLDGSLIGAAELVIRRLVDDPRGIVASAPSAHRSPIEPDGGADGAHQV